MQLRLNRTLRNGPASKASAISRPNHSKGNGDPAKPESSKRGGLTNCCSGGKRMPLYFSAHTTACLTKQALRQLMQDLLAATHIRVCRCVASQVGGRMLTEVEAPNQAALEKW